MAAAGVAAADVVAAGAEVAVVAAVASVAPVSEMGVTVGNTENWNELMVPGDTAVEPAAESVIVPLGPTVAGVAASTAVGAAWMVTVWVTGALWVPRLSMTMSWKVTVPEVFVTVTAWVGELVVMGWPGAIGVGGLRMPIGGMIGLMTGLMTGAAVIGVVVATGAAVVAAAASVGATAAGVAAAAVVAVGVAVVVVGTMFSLGQFGCFKVHWYETMVVPVGEVEVLPSRVMVPPAGTAGGTLIRAMG